MTDDRFETSRFMATDLWDVSSIDAEDELPIGVSGERRLALVTFLRVNPFKEHALFFFFFRSLANRQSWMSQSLAPSCRLPRQKISRTICRCPVGDKCTRLGRQRHRLGGRSDRIRLGDRGDCEINAGNAAAAWVQPGALHSDSAVHRLDRSGPIALDRPCSATFLAMTSKQNE